MKLDKKAKDFIEKAKTKGYSKDQVREYLIGKGYELTPPSEGAKKTPVETPTETLPKVTPQEGAEERYGWEDYTDTLLPLTGAILGGISGMGIGSVPASAVGAAAGDALAQGVANIAHDRGGLDVGRTALTGGTTLVGGLAGKALGSVGGKMLPGLKSKAGLGKEISHNVVSIKTGKPIKTPTKNFTSPNLEDVTGMLAVPKYGIPRYVAKQPIANRAAYHALSGLTRLPLSGIGAGVGSSVPHLLGLNTRKKITKKD